MKIQKQTKISAYKADGFLKDYQKLVKDEVIPYQYDVLCDKTETGEKSHVVKNFINAKKALLNENVEDGFYGMVFQDSDAAKWLEAAAYSLSCFPDSKLEEKADRLIDIIAQAQDEDGYLNTYFTIKDKERRWTNLLEGHELYCSGHMMEASCAYFEATGKDKLLSVMLKNAKHIYERFIENKKEGYPGHPEIELALLKMYRLTGEKFCLELCSHFVDARGVDTHFFEKEAEKRNWQVWGMPPKNLEYNQSHKPVREQADAVGHAVRAVYLYTAMADLAGETDDIKLKQACEKLWQSITEKRMYITGAIGSTVHGEAFTKDYDLPGDTAYAETCASIGLMFFASKMLEMNVNSKYSDIMEIAFYNTVLSGMALDGKSFFYVNPLSCIPGISGKAVTHNHVKTQRSSWYACACCPPNVARTVGSIGKYAYGENENTCFCHLYAAGEVQFENGMKMVCKTEYPYGFDVNYKIISGGKCLALRIPFWSEKFSLFVNGKSFSGKMLNGYVYLDTKDGDEVKLMLNGEPYFVYPSPKIPSLSGKVCICRGPLVYCFEGTDNDGDILSLSLKSSGKISVSKETDKRLKNAVMLEADAIRTEKKNELYSLKKPKEENCKAKAIPYYTWCNRGETQMNVWLSAK